MTRKYTVKESRSNGLPPIEHTYVGFSRKFDGAQYISSVSVQGDIEWYALDSPEATDELIRYLHQQGEDGVILATFKRM